MIKITIEDTENRGEPMVLTGEFGFAIAKINENEEGVPYIGSIAMGDINFMSMPRDIAAMGKQTRYMIKNLDDSKQDGIIRVLSFEYGFKQKEE